MAASVDPSMMDPTKTPVFPAPPGMVSNLDNPHTYRKESVATHVILLSVATLALIVRLYTRGWIKGRLRLDDYITILAWAFSANFSAWWIAALYNGVGRHLWDIPLSMFLDIGKYSFIVQLLYQPTTLAIKLSVLFCYHAIFNQRGPTAQFLIWFGVFACSIFYVVLFFCSLFYCDPIAKAYNPALPGKCMSFTALPWASGVFNVLSDAYIMVLPIPFVWSLRMKMERKARLLAVFGLGIFTVVASIMRLVWVAQNINATDQSYEYVRTGYWIIIELDIGLICACALVFPAFFDSENRGSLGSLIKKLRSASQSKSSLRSGSVKSGGSSINKTDPPIEKRQQLTVSEQRV
ncbi:Nn.00g094340.m01.CDS01 [Neocucurbitaria sp. VM-36]